MPDFIDGLPLHPLIVHFVVVLLPIAVLGSILTAVWPAVRRRFGWLAVAAAGVSAALVPVATDSGESLATRLPADPQIERHQELGELLIWWALPLFVAVTALMVVHTMSERKVAAEKKVKVGAAGAEQEDEQVTETPQRSGGRVVATIVAAVLTVGIAVGTGVHIFRVGDAGARAVWEGIENLPPANGGG